LNLISLNKLVSTVALGKYPIYTTTKIENTLKILILDAIIKEETKTKVSNIAMLKCYRKNQVVLPKGVIYSITNNTISLFGMNYKKIIINTFSIPHDV
jgi:hypothetical protein